MDSGATMLGGEYRLHLYRQVAPSGVPTRVVFIMLNPSTADAETDDPTIRRCIGFVRRWGYGWLDVVNLSPVRATDPDVLRTHHEPYGPEGGERNLREIRAVLANPWVRMVVAAFGSTWRNPNGQKVILAATERHNLLALGLTKDGSPRHPLYMRNDCEPVIWRPAHTPAATWKEAT